MPGEERRRCGERKMGHAKRPSLRNPLKYLTMVEMEGESKRRVQRFSDARNIPEGAVILTEDEVEKMKWDIIEKWKPKIEMWPLNYGNLITGGIASFSGALLNYHYRQQFKLRTLGRYVSYAPVVVIPFLMTATFQAIFVTLPITSDRINCPLCAEIRSGCLQTCFGFIQPILLSTLGCTALSKTFHTIAMPPDWAGVVQMHVRMLRPIHVPIVALFGLNIIAAMYITQEQGRMSIKVLKQLQGQFSG